jgi:D-cysteine desulfhydrase family pyridoxal phosphate-dependent enzyme
VKVQLPRVQLAHLPTTIEPLPRLSAALKGPQLWIKRDDQTGLAFGGNKTRKLEYLLADARAQGAELLITRGARQSNHCRQTAAAAARSGFECTLVLSGSAPSEITGNLLLDQLLGVEIVWTEGKDPEQMLEATFNQAWEAGRRPYLIPYGGSNATGASAYVAAISELVEQGMKFDRIVFASSSGGTQAGMIVGAKALEIATRITGISVDKPSDKLQQIVLDLAHQISELLRLNLEFQTDEVDVDDRYLGGGYAVMGEIEREAIELFASTEGILLDPVYTGRAAGGMIDRIRKGEFGPEERILFWHTGGTPALFAYAEELTTSK